MQKLSSDAARELERFTEWAAGERGDDWTSIVPESVDRESIFGDPEALDLLRLQTCCTNTGATCSEASKRLYTMNTM